MHSLEYGLVLFLLTGLSVILLFVAVNPEDSHLRINGFGFRIDWRIKGRKPSPQRKRHRSVHKTEPTDGTASSNQDDPKVSK